MCLKQIQKVYNFVDVDYLFASADRKYILRVLKVYEQILNCDQNIALHCYVTAILARNFFEYLIEKRFIVANQDKIHTFTAAALLHDIGKIDPTILAIVNNGRKITHEERVQMQKHSNLGYQIIQEEGLDDVALIILHHHELWDGSGYPNGLKGEDIPLFCRILTICDSFAAMMDFSRIIYKGGVKTSEEALKDMTNYKGVWYDANILELFSSFVKEKFDHFKDFFSVSV